MPYYYKDNLDGRFPVYSHAPLNDPRFVAITEAEWNALRQGASTDDHPYSPYVLNRDLMAAAARDHLPPPGTAMPASPSAQAPSTATTTSTAEAATGAPDPTPGPATGLPAATSTPAPGAAPATGVIAEEGK